MKQENEFFIIAIIAMGAVLIVECVALAKGVDGVALATSLGAFLSIAGLTFKYFIKKLKGKKK